MYNIDFTLHSNLNEYIREQILSLFLLELKIELKILLIFVLVLHEFCYLIDNHLDMNYVEFCL